MRQHIYPIEDCTCPKCGAMLNGGDLLYQSDGDEDCCELCIRAEIGLYPLGTDGDRRASYAFDTIIEALDIRKKPAGAYWNERAGWFSE